MRTNSAFNQRPIKKDRRAFPQAANESRQRYVHKVDDISFTDNWIRCACGSEMKAVTFPKALDSEPWREHKRSMGEHINT